MATQIKGTNQEFLEILKGLEVVKGIKGKTFGILVARNILHLSKHLKHINNAAKPSTAFNEVAAVAHKFAESEDTESLKALEEKHKDVVDARKKQLKEVEEMLLKESEVDINLIREELIPDEVTAEQILPLLKILKD